MGGQAVDKDQYVGRLNGFVMDPLKLFVVGIDTPPGRSAPHGPKDHAGYDDRVRLPVDTALGCSLLQEGNLQPIRARKNGTLLEVVYGRQRVRSARWVNEQIDLHWQEVDGQIPSGSCELPEHLRESLERDTRVTLKVEVGRDDDKRLLAAMSAENHQRREEDVVTTARKLDAYLERGHTYAQAKVTFRLRYDREIQTLLKLLQLHPDLQERVVDGRLPQTTAVPLADLNHDQQLQVVAQVEEQGKGLTPTRIRAAINTVLGNAAPVKPKKTGTELQKRFALLERLQELLEEDRGLDEPVFDAPAEDVLLLKWAVGRGIEARDVEKYIPWLVDALEALDDGAEP